MGEIVATHYSHVDGTSFATPIVSSIVAQMIEANPKLTPGAVKNIQYKFIVDGGVDDERWVEDPSNGMKAPDNRGGLNSLLVIE